MNEWPSLYLQLHLLSLPVLFVDIKFSACDEFLESPSSGTFKYKRLKSQITKKSIDLSDIVILGDKPVIQPIKAKNIYKSSPF